MVLAAAAGRKKLSLIAVEQADRAPATVHSLQARMVPTDVAVAVAVAVFLKSWDPLLEVRAVTVS
jgi:hypothetical protein